MHLFPFNFFVHAFLFQLFIGFLLCVLLTSFLFFVKVKALKQRVDFSVPTFFATQSVLFIQTDCVAFIMRKKARSVFHT